jgi:hypothetical protein
VRRRVPQGAASASMPGPAGLATSASVRPGRCQGVARLGRPRYVAALAGAARCAFHSSQMRTKLRNMVPPC